MSPFQNRWGSLLRRALWALLPLGPRQPIRWQPSLPPSMVISLPGRGETAVRKVNGPPGSSTVLLLHGVTWSSEINFHLLIDELARRHTVITMDHRGHGSGLPVTGRLEMADLADDAVAVLDALDVPTAVVAGFSLGSLTALHIAHRHPARVDGLVLSAGALVLRTSAIERTLAHLPGIAFSALRGSRFGRTVAARYFGQNRRTRDEGFERRWPWLRAELERTSARSVAPAMRAAARHDARGHVDALRHVPAVVVAHRRDVLVPAHMQFAMARELAAEVIDLHTDHEAPVSHPELYRDAMAAAVARVDELVRDTRKDGRSA